MKTKVATLLLFFLIITFGVYLRVSSNSEKVITSFPNAQYLLESEVLGANTVRLTNNSNKAIYELTVTGNAIQIDGTDFVTCGNASGDFDICLLKEVLQPGEEYLITTNSSANGKLTYFAKDAFDSIVVTNQL